MKLSGFGVVVFAWVLCLLALLGWSIESGNYRTATSLAGGTLIGVGVGQAVGRLLTRKMRAETERMRAETERLRAETTKRLAELEEEERR